MKNEIWLPIKGYNGVYIISNYGNAFNTAIVPTHIILKQIEHLPDRVSSVLCLSDYGEYVSHLKHKYGNDCKVYCCPTTLHGYQMCIGALSVYEDNPGEFVIFNKERYSSFNIEYFEDTLKERDVQFDIVVGNPPYGEDKKGSSRTLHYKIMNAVLKFCKSKLVFIMPSAPITKQLNDYWYNMFVNAVCNKICVLDTNVFPSTNMPPTAIYYCDRNDSPENYCKKLDVDDVMYYFIDSYTHRLFIDKMNKTKELKIGFTFGSKYDYLKKFDSFKKRANKDYYFLNVNRAGNKSLFFTKTFLDIDILDYNDENDFLLKNTSVKNVISCPTKEYGYNLKNLMVNGVVLRYGLWLTQRDRNIVQTQFRYIPDLDYTNIHTDEELLTACGFTPEEIEKTMEYLRHFDFSKNRNEVVRNYTGYEVYTDKDE